MIVKFKLTEEKALDLDEQFGKADCRHNEMEYREGKVVIENGYIHLWLFPNSILPDVTYNLNSLAYIKIEDEKRGDE